MHSRQPCFRRGYHTGRAIHFAQEAPPPTDKELVECVKALVEEGVFTTGEEADAYYILGQFIGRMSGAVLPRQPEECDPQQRQQHLLASLRQAYGENEQTERLIAAITTLWQVQDDLATLLHLDDYQRVLQRDMQLSL